MKNLKTITLGDREIRLKFTLGVIGDFQDHIGVGVDIDEALSKANNIMVFLSLMAHYADNPVTAEEFKYLDFSEVARAMEAIGEATGKLTAKAQT